MFGAGSDTTASAISVGVMASACYPEAAEKVRKELDTVIGRERREFVACEVVWFIADPGLAPQLSDQDSLPQTMAFVLETFRWRPVSSGGMCSLSLMAEVDLLTLRPLGFAHKASKDIIWVCYIPSSSKKSILTSPSKITASRMARALSETFGEPQLWGLGPNQFDN